MWRIGQPSQKYILLYLPNAISHLTSIRCTKTVSWPGMHSHPQRPRYFRCWQKGARPLGTRMPEENADIAQLRRSCFDSLTLNINAWDANCLFAVNTQCLKKTSTLKNRQRIKRVAYCESCDKDLTEESCAGSTVVWREEYRNFACESRIEWLAQGHVLHDSRVLMKCKL